MGMCNSTTVPRSLTIVDAAVAERCVSLYVFSELYFTGRPIVGYTVVCMPSRGNDHRLRFVVSTTLTSMLLHQSPGPAERMSVSHQPQH